MPLLILGKSVPPEREPGEKRASDSERESEAGRERGGEREVFKRGRYGIV